MNVNNAQWAIVWHSRFPTIQPFVEPHGYPNLVTKLTFDEACDELMKWHLEQAHLWMTKTHETCDYYREEC